MGRLAQAQPQTNAYIIRKLPDGGYIVDGAGGDGFCSQALFAATHFGEVAEYLEERFN